MAKLDWHPSDQGFDSGIYHIRPWLGYPGHNWRLEIGDGTPRIPGIGPTPAVSGHRSLKTARATALHLEVQRIRNLRLQRHLAVGIAMTAVLFPLAQAALAKRTISFTAFVVAIVLLSGGLAAFARATDVKLGSGWGHLYGEPEAATHSDEAVGELVEWLTPRDRGRTDDPPTPSIRVLPPE